MASLNSKSIIVFLFSVVVLIPTLNANIGKFDEYWQQQAQNALKVAYENYNPHPENITNGFTKQIEHVMTGTNGTRRNLGKKDGPCTATNPIDRCWRCRPDWESDRFRLADCVKGFGHKTTGGKGGKIYVVTDSSDHDLINPKRGTLRHAVIQDEPLWIIFARPMVIRLSEELLINSHKTIDARGANVHIAHGAGLTVQYKHNVIIHGLHIHDIHAGKGGYIRDSLHHYGERTKSDGDGISLFGATNVWIDHVSMSNCEDGLIDAIMGCTGITISNCHFAKHNEVMLFGANEKHIVDKIMQITVAFNHFGKGLIQRMPRCRFGFIHVVNNDYTHWLKYAIGGSQHPTIISQGNRFIAPHDDNAKEITHRDYATEAEWKTWTWRSEGDLYMNGAFFREAGEPLSEHNYTRYQFIKAKPGSWVRRLTRYTGPIKCKPNKPC